MGSNVGISEGERHGAVCDWCNVGISEGERHGAVHDWCNVGISEGERHGNNYRDKHINQYLLFFTLASN